jgi:hypothetical protein
MFRLATSMFALTAAAALGGPVLAADWSEDPAEIFREGYSMEPYEWSEMGDQSDGIHIETGLRYWYSMGSRSVSGGGASSDSEDAAHIGEVFLRLEDDATATWAHAYGGYSMIVEGEADGVAIGDGDIGYIGADFGWKALDDDKGSGAGLFAGYLYWLEAPDTGRTNFTTANSSDDIAYDPLTGQTIVPGDSAPTRLDIQALRLGVSGNAKLGEFFDIRAEVAAVPFATVSGHVGVDDITFDDSVYNGPAQPPFGGGGANGNISTIRASETTVDGVGYGAMAEVWLGAHPTENLTFRLGGRAWYLEGTADATYSMAQIGNPGDADVDGEYDTAPSYNEVGVIETNNPFSMLRYGLLAEMTYSF